MMSKVVSLFAAFVASAEARCSWKDAQIGMSIHNCTGGKSPPCDAYPSLVEAVSVCDSQAGCGGVTFDTLKKWYELRQGPNISKDLFGMSWVCSDEKTAFVPPAKARCLWKDAQIGMSIHNCTGGKSPPCDAYPSLVEAESVCESQAGCGGVTFDTLKKWYELRQGPQISKDLFSNSWTCSDEKTAFVAPAKARCSWKDAQIGMSIHNCTGGKAPPCDAYPSLVEAESVCDSQAGCGGVTFDTLKKWYELRQGPEISKDLFGMSWVCSDDKILEILV